MSLPLAPFGPRTGLRGMVAAADQLAASAGLSMLERGGSAADAAVATGAGWFAQSLAMLRSLSLGGRPDDPNAAGTVSRVVKGVSIHPWRGT